MYYYPTKETRMIRVYICTVKRKYKQCSRLTSII